MHNPKHHSFFNTLSLAIDVHPDVWQEIYDYCKHHTKFYGIKAEDVNGEGKVHVHWVQFLEFAKHDPAPSRFVTMYGPRRPEGNKEHLVKHCPLLAGAIANYGSKYALQSLPLTSTQWIEYLNKEAPCKLNNLPDDPTVMQPYLSEHLGEKVGDPGFTADAAKYKAYHDQGVHWAIDPPTDKSCRVFYRVQMFADKKKRVAIVPVTIKNKAAALQRFINSSIYSDDEDGLATPVAFPPGWCGCHGVALQNCLECSASAQVPQ